MIRVLLVDDASSVRRAFRTTLELSGDIEVVGEAASGPVAVARASALRPDVVLMDIRMPGGDGIAATRALLERWPEQAVLVMTAFDLDDLVFDALASGARGFVVKIGEPDELVRAVRAVAHGDGWLSPRVARRVIRRASSNAAPEGQDLAEIARLTSREADVVRALCAGGSTRNEAVAVRLGLATTTIKSHLSRAMQKLDVDSRAELVIWAYRVGLAP